MTYHVEISPTAANMLFNHITFLSKSSVDAAKRLREAFREQVSSLTEMPHRCPYMSGVYFPYQKYRKLIFSKHYALIYTIEEDNQTVYVDYMIDFRSDFVRLFQ